MEYNKTEVELIDQLVADTVEFDVRELNELQLALISGGAGDAVIQ